MARAEDYAKAIAVINAARRVLLTSHVRPDGDAAGCMAAMWELLKGLGKEVHPLFLSPLPAWYSFLFDANIPVLGRDIGENALNAEPYAACDLAIILDTNSYVQLPVVGKWLKTSGMRVLVIDHHITSDHIGDTEVVDAAASATGIVCSHLIKRGGWKLTPRLATALFTAVGTDTGWFRFASVDSQTFSVAKVLAEAGAKPAELYRRLYQNYSAARMRLLARLMLNMKLEMENRLAIVLVTSRDFAETGAEKNDTDNLIDEFQRIESVEAVLMAAEQDDGGWRCSLRSRGLVDVQKIAAMYGGGGHKAASGVTMNAPLEEVLGTLQKEVAAQLAQPAQPSDMNRRPILAGDATGGNGPTRIRT
ncbi:MAG TPA: bifunctional oligoribonuclease/PAP phosphatase NrnA [Sedimentisphaerales bacterium]|nr:bifunctional oligoribonuclease/PAP phosphatase NrnA [Sedimentisphaerales bacterium]